MKSKAKANQKFDKKAYDTLGIKTKKGIKNMLEIIADNYNMNKSTLVKNAISDYVEKLIGSNIIESSLNDFEMIIRYVLISETIKEQVYICSDNFHYLLDLRNRAEKNYGKIVISEKDFISKFSETKENIIIANKSIYDDLYLLVYQAHI